jgi:RNA polymerase sigma-70 factor (ECF subfamily)
MSNQNEDERLVSEVLLGVRGAPERLFARLGPIIKAVVRRRFKPPDDDDAAQEIYARLHSSDWRALRLWNKDSPLQAYVATIAKNVCYDIFRRRRPETLFGDGPTELLDEDPAADPEAMTFAQQIRECLERAMNALSETYRDIVRLRHVEDLKHAEIAERLGRTMGYVGTTLARAERYLREEIRERCADHLGHFEAVVR